MNSFVKPIAESFGSVAELDFAYQILVFVIDMVIAKWVFAENGYFIEAICTPIKSNLLDK